MRKVDNHLICFSNIGQRFHNTLTREDQQSETFDINWKWSWNHLFPTIKQNTHLLQHSQSIIESKSGENSWRYCIISPLPHIYSNCSLSLAFAWGGEADTRIGLNASSIPSGPVTLCFPWHHQRFLKCIRGGGRIYSQLVRQMHLVKHLLLRFKLALTFSCLLVGTLLRNWTTSCFPVGRLEISWIPFRCMISGFVSRTPVNALFE